MKSFDHTRTDFSPYGFTCEIWKPALMKRPDRHNEIEINLLLSGSLTYLIGGRRITIRAGQFAVFWAAIPHQIVAAEGRQPYFVVTLPLGWFLSSGFPESFVHTVLKGSIVSEESAFLGDEARFGQWSSDLQSPDAVRERAALLEIQARLLRMAREQPKRRHGKPSPALNLSKADQLAAYIARHYAEPISADAIAKASGLHPNYAMNLFRKAFGTTITDFITQHRISHAQRLLVTTHDPIVEIAFASGFQSLSRFNEAFKRACGCSPREYRRRHELG
jgi:AraC-like DNA-binding protein